MAFVANDKTGWEMTEQIPDAEKIVQRLERLLHGLGFEKDAEMVAGRDIQNATVGAYVTVGRTYWFCPDASPTIQAYSLLHEMAHVFGKSLDRLYNEIPLELVEAIMTGKVDMRDVPIYVEEEAMAEGAVTMILMQWGLEPNWEFYLQWKIGKDVLEKVTPRVRQVSRLLWEAITAPDTLIEAMIAPMEAERRANADNQVGADARERSGPVESVCALGAGDDDRAVRGERISGGEAAWSADARTRTDR